MKREKSLLLEYETQFRLRPFRAGREFGSPGVPERLLYIFFSYFYPWVLCESEQTESEMGNRLYEAEHHPWLLIRESRMLDEGSNTSGLMCLIVTDTSSGQGSNPPRAMKCELQQKRTVDVTRSREVLVKRTGLKLRMGPDPQGISAFYSTMEKARFYISGFSSFAYA
ncbi:hypothetical protein C8J57DRAFT_1254354 [Mycena rebaudengoi]|nr:hypothetical protein C8J57DRAFT_1254354 [Mycena rebaudengoi]